MIKNHLDDLLLCSAGTFCNITDLRRYDEVAAFTAWIVENYQELPQGANCLITIDLCFRQYESDRCGEQLEIELSDVVESQSGMSLAQAREYLNERGLESLIPGGFVTLSRMQHGLVN